MINKYNQFLYYKLLRFYLNLYLIFDILETFLFQILFFNKQKFENKYNTLFCKKKKKKKKKNGFKNFFKKKNLKEKKKIIFFFFFFFI